MIGKPVTLADVIAYFDDRIAESDRMIRDYSFMDAPVNAARERAERHRLIMLRDAVKRAADMPE